jgi:Na+-transporting methylmalonyl-CoA/oxaloacetate decarboxylase gamma subunit
MKTLNSRVSTDKPVLKNKQVQDLVKVGLGFVSTLIALDVAINLLFPYPADPLNTSPGAMNLYFDYGRSIEGKVSRQMGKTDETTAPIARVGWLDAHLGDGEPIQPAPGKPLLVAIYGMSFASNVGQALLKLDPSITLRVIAGPAAPPNFSFAAYEADRDRHQAKVVILGILASSVKGMGAMTGMTWGAEVPAPYTFPKYAIEADQLKAIQPAINSLTELRTALNQPQQRDAFVDQLREQDQFFDSFVFEKNLLDASAIARMIRRAWAKSHQDNITSQIHTPTGFNPNWNQTPVLKRMVEEFATTAKQDGRVPIVLLFNDQGYDDHLYRLLKPTLEKNQIAFVSSHDVAPANDRSNFVGDGHFTPAVDQRLAEKVLAVVNQSLERSTSAALESNQRN